MIRVTEKRSIVIIGLADNLCEVGNDNASVSEILESSVSFHILSNFLWVSKQNLTVASVIKDVRLLI